MLQLTMETLDIERIGDCSAVRWDVSEPYVRQHLHQDIPWAWAYGRKSEG